MKEINFVAPSFEMDSCNTVLTKFESVDEILWCDHSNELSVVNAEFHHRLFVFQRFAK